MSTELWQRLRAARKYAKVTQQQIADECSIKREAVAQWESTDPKRRTYPGIDNLKRFSKRTGAPINWLLDDDNSLDPEQWMEFSPALRVHDVDLSPPYFSASATRPGYVRFPQLEGYAGMGRGDYVGDYPEIVDWIEVTQEWAAQKLAGVPHDSVRVITGRGHSMRGVFDDGDLVFVDSRIKQFDADAAYVFRWDGRVQIKRLQFIGQGRLRILSANPDYPPLEVEAKDIEIGGRAIAAWTLRNL